MSGAVNYDEVVTTLKAQGFELTHLEYGRMCRVKRTGHSQKGWYVVHEITLDDGREALIGSYGYWESGEKVKEKIAPGKDIKISRGQQDAIRKRHAEDVRRAQLQRDREILAAARRAEAVWLKALPTGDSEYLGRKGIQPLGVRFTEQGAIVVPMQDNTARTFGLQFILPSSHPRKKKTGRDKEFWPAGMEMKGKYFLIGGVPSSILLIAEGYATAATLHQATGLPVAVAFTAGNLLPVAEVLKKRYRKARMLICADDDYLTEGNPGCRYAESAALAVGGAWVKPVFTVDREGKKLTDFNDLQALEGLHVVKIQLEEAIHTHGWAVEAPVAAGALNKGSGEALKPLLNVQEAIERYSLIYGAGGTMYDHQEYQLIPKSDVLDICVDHAWREWKLSAERKVVRLSEVGFDPTGKDTTIKCNLWGGWPTKPQKGSCEILLDLLRYLCSGEENKDSTAVFEWVLKWLAYPLQHQGAKMRTALIFHGPQGAGKNLFFEAYAAIYGEYGRIIGQTEIDDKFNDWASRKLFMIADEVVARQELFHIKNKIKALITGDKIRINPKNVAAHDERNHANILFLSNEVQPLVLEKDDRRFTVVWVPDKLPKNYYSDVAEEIHAGGIAALHDYLLNLDLGDFNEYSEPPMTQAKRDLIEINLESGQRFIDDWEVGAIQVPVMPGESKDIYRLYQHWARMNGIQRPRELSQLVGSIARMRQWKKERKRIWSNYKFEGEQYQANVIVPPEDMIETARRQNGLLESRWLTESVLDFRQLVDDATRARGGGDD
jgi:Uncharacterized protein conserved in bacteria